MVRGRETRGAERGRGLGRERRGEAEGDFGIEKMNFCLGGVAFLFNEKKRKGGGGGGGASKRTKKLRPSSKDPDFILLLLGYGFPYAPF